MGDQVNKIQIRDRSCSFEEDESYNHENTQGGQYLGKINSSRPSESKHSFIQQSLN